MDQAITYSGCSTMLNMKSTRMSFTHMGMWPCQGFLCRQKPSPESNRSDVIVTVIYWPYIVTVSVVNCRTEISKWIHNVNTYIHCSSETNPCKSSVIMLFFLINGRLTLYSYSILWLISHVATYNISQCTVISYITLWSTVVHQCCWLIQAGASWVGCDRWSSSHSSTTGEETAWTLPCVHGLYH